MQNNFINTFCEVRVYERDGKVSSTDTHGASLAENQTPRFECLFRMHQTQIGADLENIVRLKSCHAWLAAVACS